MSLPAVIVLMGVSGSGKSTLLSLIDGVRSPCEGEIRLKGNAPGKMRRKDVARLVAVVPQETSWIFPMTVEEFLAWEDVHAEWVDGEVTVFMPVSELHQAISNFFETLLTLYVKLYNLGIIRSAPYSMRAPSGGSIREPDLSLIQI